MGQLAHLRLRDFRNYPTLDLDFSNGGIHLFTGENGQGKTNLLEAIHYLSLLRSFRTRQTNQLRRFGAAELHASCELVTNSEACPSEVISVTYGAKRQLTVGDKSVSKASEFVNRFVCIALVPEDIELVKGGASLRRRFADIALSQLSPVYMQRLQSYVTALACRNAMLRDPQTYDRSALSAYDGLLIQHGVWITEQRVRFAALLGDVVTALCRQLVAEKEFAMSLRYRSQLQREAESTGQEASVVFRDLLGKSLARDQQEGVTRVGPHRDDFVISLNDKLMSEYASQGQCRIAALTLRLASLELTKKWGDGVGRPTVLLVDDVLGELDNLRRQEFLKVLTGADQTFVACTEEPDVPELADRISSVYRVSSGTVCPASSAAS